MNLFWKQSGDNIIWGYVAQDDDFHIYSLTDHILIQPWLSFDVHL